MLVQRVSRCSAILVLLLACSVGVAVGQDNESGAVPGFRDEAGAARVVPPGLDDMLQPIEGLTEPGPEYADVRDTAGEPEPTQPRTALWEQLTGLDPEQRSNAVIELELGRDATDADREAAEEIAALWNGGEYEPAIELLRSLESAGVGMGLGIAWIVPQQPGGLRGGGDVRIGDPREGAETMSLDFDAQNGNLFTVVLWDGRWTMNMSTNGGTTWAETYVWSGGLVDVDCVVVDDYVYVAYVTSTFPDEGRMRRCFVSDGTVDNVYFWHIVVDASPNTIEEVALASNADDFDNRIYYFAIQSNDVLRYFWDVASDGTTFQDGGSPAVANAESGLDATWDNSRGSCDDFLYVSYTGNDSDIHVQGRDENSWTDWNVESGAGSFRTTAISAYGDTIICAFEWPYAEGTGIRYRISYNCGGSWSPGSLAIPDGSTVLAYFEPDIDARDGDGTACIYQVEVGEPDPMYYRTREGFAPGPWSDPVQFNDFDVVTGTDTAMNYLPPLGGETFSHGALYINDLSARIPYFDRPGTGSPPCDDNTPPIVEIDLPATLSCACDLVDITGSVSDPNGTYVGDRLEYRRRSEAAWTLADTAVGERAGVLYTWDTSLLPQDFYYVRVVGENECALTDTDSTFVYKSTTFGNIDLRAPVDGRVYGGTICVDGTAWTQSCFDHYTVDYRTAGVGPWAPVDPPNSPYTSTVINDPLASWNTVAGPSAVADGDYDVRLEGVTDCNDVTTEVHTIIVDNTRPDAEITSPIPCEYVTGLVEVFGTADDANLSSWALQYTGDGVSGWVTINSDVTPVVGGLLGTWDTTGLPSCAYTLRVRVTDMANVNCSGNTHQSEYHVSVNVGCPEDIDGNGVIDLADLAALLAVYGQTCP